MNNIWNSIKLDYYILKSANLSRISILALVPLVVGVLSKNPPLILGFLMTISGFFMSTIFGVAEKSNLNKLYGTLPVAKQQTVIGRYLFTLLAGTAVALIGIILTYVAAAFLSIHLNGLEFTVWICGSFLLFCLVVATQFPLYFKYDFSKLAGLANLPYILLILLGSYLLRKDAAVFGHAIIFFLHNHYMIWVSGIGGGVLLLAASCFVSIPLYNSREL